MLFDQILLTVLETYAISATKRQILIRMLHSFFQPIMFKSVVLLSAADANYF